MIHPRSGTDKIRLTQAIDEYCSSPGEEAETGHQEDEINEVSMESGHEMIDDHR